MIEIELKKHIGHMTTELGPVEVEFDQWIVMANPRGEGWKQIGYLGKGEQAGFCPIVQIHESFVGMVKEKLEKLKGMPVRMGTLSGIVDDGAD